MKYLDITPDFYRVIGRTTVVRRTRWIVFRERLAHISSVFKGLTVSGW